MKDSSCRLIRWTAAFAVILQENSRRVNTAQARMAAISFENSALVMRTLLIKWVSHCPDGLYRYFVMISISL